MSSETQKGKMMVAKEDRKRRRVHVAIRWTDTVLLKCGAHATSFHEWVCVEDVDVDLDEIERCDTCFGRSNYGTPSNEA